jgi:hypothetical protein
MLSIRKALPILSSATTYEAFTVADQARLGCVGIPRANSACFWEAA